MSAADRFRRWQADPATRAGLLGALWSVAPSYARGLLPRSPVDQAITTGVIALANYELTATTWASVTASVAGRPGNRPSTERRLVAAVGTVAVGAALERLTATQARRHLGAALAGAVGERLVTAGVAGGATTTLDVFIHRAVGRQRGIETTLLLDATVGGLLATATVWARNRRAHRFGLVDPDRPAVLHGTPRSLAQAVLAGGGAAAAITGLAVIEQSVAESVTALVERVGGGESGSAGAFVGHGVALLATGAAGLAGLREIRARIERRDDVVEPAYTEAPSSPYVSAGPASEVRFADIGKEGRRFVLMALTAADITSVMGEPSREPVRVVAGYASSRDVTERARIAVRDLVALGGLERSLIVVAAPTGVGYVNYVAAEAIEYLARGDCAIVVPQYALVPSALALGQTRAGERLQRLVLAGITEHLSKIPAARRPRVVQFGESLGAEVALDVAGGGGPQTFAAMGIVAGLYLGVPFRSALWERWRDDGAAVDPQGRLVLVAEPNEIPPGDATGRHIMVVHHDDPVNKFSYQMAVQQPWWLGEPHSRPPLVPRETAFRPLTTFVLTVVDLKNGMNAQPGAFRRRGHDYRIDAAESVAAAYGLPLSTAQLAAVEAALRRRETEWAQRRLVSRAYADAVAKIKDTLTSWGDSTVLIDVADEVRSSGASNSAAWPTSLRSVFGSLPT